MFTVLSLQEAKEITGGNPYIWQCWDTKGNEYWDTEPNSAGCKNSVTGEWKTGTKKQRKGGGK